MDLEFAIKRMWAGANAIQALTTNVDDEQARWKPSPDHWSVLEVMCHWHDEERYDFRARLELLLHDPDAEWPAFDPEGWVTERKYNEQDFEASLDRFLTERARSIEWLGELEAPAWDNAHEHPRLGTLRAGDIMVSWVGHDVLHVRQLSQLQWEYIKLKAKPYSPDYASPG